MTAIDSAKEIKICFVGHENLLLLAPEFGKHGVRLSREVAVGEKEQLDQLDDTILARWQWRRERRRVRARPACRSYVSHVDIFSRLR